MNMKQSAFIEELGERAKRARKARGWTQQQAADAVGMSLRRYGDIERGEAGNVTSETIEAITSTLLHNEGASVTNQTATRYTDAGGQRTVGTFDPEKVFTLVIRTKTSTIRLPVVAVGMPVIEGEPEVHAEGFELE